MKEGSIMSLNGLRDYLIESKILADGEEFEQKVCVKMNEIMKLVFCQAKNKLDRKFGCFELYGFDFMIDDKLNPHLLEINVNPALFTDT
jgi:D-alanine-D-alanine ligase-like ATP-grasp enzyme